MNVSKLIDEILEKRMEIKETFFAMYLKQTGLDISQVVLVEQTCEENYVLKTKWYLEPKHKLERSSKE